jgi:hypothetical protein
MAFCSCRRRPEERSGVVREDDVRFAAVRRALLPLLALPLLLAACGGTTNGSDAPTTRKVSDPARTLTRLIDAAERGDARAIRGLLVDDARVAPSELGEGLGTFAGRKPRTLYRGGPWAVAAVSGVRSVEGTREYGAYATALHRVAGRWRVDLSGATTVRILGPKPGSRTPPIPQVAAALEGRGDLVESGLWIDGAELIEKGGGSATRGTVYGAPAHPLRPGRHVAVAYARDATHATAIAWVFRV